MRAWLILTVAVALGFGLLTFRITVLEQRVDALAGRVPPSSHRSAGRGAGSGQDATGGHQLAVLEADVRALREELDSLEQAPPPAKTDEDRVADKAGGEQRILSVVEREQQRVRDRQLEFHKERWLEWREAALDDFAQRQGLAPGQTQQLHQLMSDEIDKMVDILRRPDALENPERGAADWSALLQQTDDAAHRVLAPAQSFAWDQARAAERKALWPWLPDTR